jgi:hypothetical protein
VARHSAALAELSDALAKASTEPKHRAHAWTPAEGESPAEQEGPQYSAAAADRAQPWAHIVVEARHL